MSTQTHVHYEVHDDSEITREVALHGRVLPPRDLDLVLSALPDHYEVHDAVAMLHALTSEPEVAHAVNRITESSLRAHYLRLYERALPEGWSLWVPDRTSTEGQVLTGSLGTHDIHATFPLRPLTAMREALHEITSKIPPPPGDDAPREFPA